jgi:4-amino-4-deoxy-L-arabinose transferase-like glycosyltransferase
MVDVESRRTRDTALAKVVALAQRHPGRALAVMLILHILVWTLLPLLLCPNLQLDLAESLALGKEWQLGYWKHPPLPWWISALSYDMVGDVRVVYALGPLAVAACMYGVWLLAREVTDDVTALIAVLPLEGIHFYNFSAVKFSHDILQLPFWTFTALFFHRAITRGHPLYWLLAGATLAGAFWTKYAGFVLAATLGVILILDPHARRAWRTPGPYVMGLVFAVIVSPNAWWLVEHDFLPLRYAEVRSAGARHWYDFVLHPIEWTGGQLVILAMTLGLLAILCARRGLRRAPAADAKAAFDRRYVTAVALGPFVITTLLALPFGRALPVLWAYPFWSLAPLAVLMWFRPEEDVRRTLWFARAVIAVLIGWPLIYAITEYGEPFVRDRPKATQYPGQLLAETVTKQWRERTGAPLTYVGGSELFGAGEFAANLVAVYSPDKPHVLVHGNPEYSPWINMADLDRRGAVFVWEGPAEVPDSLRRRFPRIESLQPLVLPRQTPRPRSPVTIRYAVVPPAP